MSAPTETKVFDTTNDGPINRRLRAAGLSYDAQKNIFYHKFADVTDIPFEEWTNLAQEKLFEVGTPWGAAIFRCRPRTRSKFLDNFVGPTYARQMEKFLELETVKTPLKVANYPYFDWSYKHSINGINLVEIRNSNQAAIGQLDLHQYARRYMGGGEVLNPSNHREPTEEEMDTFQKQMFRGLPFGQIVEQPIGAAMATSAPGVQMFFEPGFDLLRDRCLQSPKSLPTLQMSSARTSFGGWVEPLQLATVNISLFGSCRLWKVLDMFLLKKLETLLAGLECSLGHDGPTQCECFTHAALSRAYTLSDQWLRENNINFTNLMQMPGDIVITFPAAFNFGFNFGFNLNIRSNLLFEQGLPYLETSLYSFSCVEQDLNEVTLLLQKKLYPAIKDVKETPLKANSLVLVKFKSQLVLGQVRACVSGAYRFIGGKNPDINGKGGFLISSKDSLLHGKTETEIAAIKEIIWNGVRKQVRKPNLDQHFYYPDVHMYQVNGPRGQIYGFYLRGEVMLINESVRFVGPFHGRRFTPDVVPGECPFEFVLQNKRLLTSDWSRVTKRNIHYQMEVKDFRHYWKVTEKNGNNNNNNNRHNIANNTRSHDNNNRHNITNNIESNTDNDNIENNKDNSQNITNNINSNDNDNNDKNTHSHPGRKRQTLSRGLYRHLEQIHVSCAFQGDPSKLFLDKCLANTAKEKR